MKIGIIGSGKFGLVLASIAMENNNEVVIFSRRKQEVDSINTNKKSLSGFSLEGAIVLQQTIMKILTHVMHCFLLLQVKILEAQLIKFSIIQNKENLSVA